MKPTLADFRFMLTDRIRQMVDFRRTDQARGVPPPPAQHPVPAGAAPIPLPAAETLAPLAGMSLWEAVRRRRSHRQFAGGALSLAETAWLLWATQGLSGPGGGTKLRTVPSAGARHPLETYVFVFAVDGLAPGLYRYLPLDHALCLLRSPAHLPHLLGQACLGQRFVGEGALAVAWTAVPYRTEWRYGEAAARVILLDAGHACQNLYLACEAIGCGTCGIGAYHQEAVDALLGVDGQEEFALYLAPVGRVPAG